MVEFPLESSKSGIIVELALSCGAIMKVRVSNNIRNTMKQINLLVLRETQSAQWHCGVLAELSYRHFLVKGIVDGTQHCRWQQRLLSCQHQQ